MTLKLDIKMNINDTYLTRKEVTSYVKVTRQTLYAWMRKGIFPRPIAVTNRKNLWRKEDIDKWMGDRPKKLIIEK